MDKKKRQQFSLKEKREIVLEVEKGGKKGGIAKKYGISPSTLSTFLKQKSKIEQNIDAAALGPQQKKMRTADYEEVDKAIYTWFVEMRAKKSLKLAHCYVSVRDPSHVRLGFQNSWGVLVGFIGSGKDVAFPTRL